jgi:NitT/TauT family transport system permease protein/sulfonate transport system permease protein
MQGNPKRWRERALWAAGILLALAAWKGLALWLGELKLPAPETILRAMFIDLVQSPILEMQGGGSNGIWPHLLYTFERTLLGSVIGILLGVLVGLVIGYSRWLRLVLEAPIETMRTIPPLAAIPFFLMWFGPTQTAQLSMMVFYCFFMLLINTVSAIANVNPIYVNYASTLGASKRQAYRTVVFPAIIPELIGGIRVAIGVAWGIQIVTELMGAQQGMGQVFSMAMPMQALDLIIVGILWITILAATTDLLFVCAARIITRWVAIER